MASSSRSVPISVPRTRWNRAAAAPAARTPVPMLKTLAAGRLSARSWVRITAAPQTARASGASNVHSRNIRMLESKPISIPPSSPSRTIGNRATRATSGTPSAAASATPSRSTPMRQRPSPAGTSRECTGRRRTGSCASRAAAFDGSTSSSSAGWLEAPVSSGNAAARGRIGRLLVAAGDDVASSRRCGYPRSAWPAVALPRRRWRQVRAWQRWPSPGPSPDKQGLRSASRAWSIGTQDDQAEHEHRDDQHEIQDRGQTTHLAHISGRRLRRLPLTTPVTAVT